jgi:23S rRNA pseudouridine2605 synthase
MEVSRAERMRHNGHGAVTLEDARTWIEETGLCLFLPRRQFSSSIAPSFVEAVAGERNSTPDSRHIATAEELLVRLETDGVAVRLNLLGQPGEVPDFVVAAWVLPYVYALRGDRDWRRSPQLTGSRQVSPLAVQAYKHLEAADATLSSLRQSLGREVTEAAVLRAITELWQQLRIIPVISAPGQPAKWQLLRHRFQKAIAEGASTSQVTAISVLASIYLQAVIAAGMEEVELFLAPLTARSKVREVLRGLVATRQVHTISLGHAPQFYVAGTLPEFAAPATAYTSSSMPAYFSYGRDREEEHKEPEAPRRVTPAPPVQSVPSIAAEAQKADAPQLSKMPSKMPATHNGASQSPPSISRPRFSRPPARSRDRKHGQAAQSSRPVRRSGSVSRPSASRPTASRPSASRPTVSRSSADSRGSRSASRPASGTRWNPKGSIASKGSRNGNGVHKPAHGVSSVRSNGNGAHANGNGNGSRTAKHAPSARNGKSAAPAWGQRNGHANGHTNGHTNGKPASKSGTASRNGSLSRNGSAAREDSRPARGKSAKPALTAGAKAGNSKRYGFTARPRQGNKKRG